MATWYIKFIKLICKETLESYAIMNNCPVQQPCLPVSKLVWWQLTYMLTTHSSYCTLLTYHLRSNAQRLHVMNIASSILSSQTHDLLSYIKHYQ